MRWDFGVGQQPSRQWATVRNICSLVQTFVFIRMGSCSQGAASCLSRLGVDTLRCKSPHMIARELLMHMIAYNLVRYLMLRAEAFRPLETKNALSFKGSVDRLDQWLWAPWFAPTEKQAKQRRDELLQTIANDEVLRRPGRKQPRVAKSRQNKFTFMTTPRHLYTRADDLAHAA
jgi:hypothetical protein